MNRGRSVAQFGKNFERNGYFITSYPGHEMARPNIKPVKQQKSHENEFINPFAYIHLDRHGQPRGPAARSLGSAGF